MRTAPHRTDWLRARVRTRELTLIRRAARAAEVTVSELIRDAALEQARRILDHAEARL